MELKVDLTSAMFRVGQQLAEERIAVMRKLALQLDVELGMQLHNSLSEEEEAWAQTLNLPLSFHAPVGNEWQINLAAEEDTIAMASLVENVEKMRKYNAKLAVFHGFVMTDKPIPAFGRGRDYIACMNDLFRPELSVDGKLMFCNDFTHLKEFQVRRERVRERLRKIAVAYPDLTFCVENDFPAYGSGNLTADTMAYLEHPLCLDVGHLWAACRVLGLDFQREISAILSTGQVKIVHFHASPYTFDQPLEVWFDGHQKLSIPNQMNLPDVIRSCRKANVNYFVFEINSAEADDLELLRHWWDDAAGGN